jgi:hypothetical protein
MRKARAARQTGQVNPEKLAGSYPIGGAWGAPAQLDFTPKATTVEGELVVSRRDGDLMQVDVCELGARCQ